jgi:outer membrane protein OmpA-like peptidoglycan-associated protein
MLSKTIMYNYIKGIFVLNINNMKNLISIFLTVFTFFISGNIFAQNDDKLWAISLHGGTAIMQGTGDIGNLSGAGGVSLKYTLANNFALRVQGYTGLMNTIKTNYNSATTFYEGNLQAILNLVNFKSQTTGRNFAQLYVGLGVGYATGNIKYIPTTTIGDKSTSTIIIPMSAGIRFYLSPLIDIGAEYTTRSTFIVNLDGATGAGIQGGRFYDFYNMPNVFITFNLGSNMKARNLEWTEATEKLYDELIKAKLDAQNQIAALKKENEDLIAAMKIEMNIQMHDNQRKADSSMKVMQATMKNDGDSDGVSNIFDKELNSPSGAIVDGGGRTLDVDKDGVPDYIDKCPTVAGKVSNFGCPLQPTKAQLATISDGIKNLQFETGKAIIKSTSFPALDLLAQMLIENASFAFLIEGHTDNVGKPADNMFLSQQRADAVKSYLVVKGVDVNRITAKGYGDTRPIYSNDTDAGKAKNRRVDMTIE